MTNIDKLQKLKDRLNKIKLENEVEKKIIATQMKKLKQYGISSLKEAEKVLTKMESEYDEILDRIDILREKVSNILKEET